MDHKYAIENHTAERYLLHELDEEQRDAYEEHFFSCSACAEEVKIASEFMDSARNVVQSDVKAQLYGDAARHSIWGSWLNFRSMLHPMPAMACALLVMVSLFSVYQNRVTIPGLRQTAATFPPIQGVTLAQLQNAKPIVVTDARRGEASGLSVPRGEAFLLQFDVPPRILGSYPSFQVDVETLAHVKKLSLRVSRQEAGNRVQVSVPFGTLESGKYEVVIQGVNSKGTESGVKGDSVHLPFEFNVQD